MRGGGREGGEEAAWWCNGEREVDSPRRVRHSAATSAVFPDPTGPPIPMRIARPVGSLRG